MSEEKLKAFLEAVKADAGLLEKLKGAKDLDAAVAIAKEAGFDVSKADFLNFQPNQAIDLSDEELENVSGGVTPLAAAMAWVVGAEAVGIGVGLGVLLTSPHNEKGLASAAIKGTLAQGLNKWS
jgi:predicted ribosomally synthesized peptide with nif11-like leader